jgi:hypothetical protein
MASLTFEGDLGLAGVAIGEVTCSFPGLITVFAAATKRRPTPALRG